MFDNTFHTVLVILGFVAIVLAPVVAAHFIGVRRRKGESGSRPAYRAAGPATPPGGEHLKPRPRKRGLR